jgi:hypothetical protein
MKNEFTPMTLAFRDSLRTFKLDTADAELDRMMDHATDALDDLGELKPLGDLFDEDQSDHDGAVDPDLYNGDVDVQVSASMIYDLYIYGGYENRRKINHNLWSERQRERASRERTWWKW